MTKLLNNSKISNLDSRELSHGHWSELLLKFKRQYLANSPETNEKDYGKRRSTKLIAVIDHDLGGGATLYSSFLIPELAENDFQVLHIKYNRKTNKVLLSYKGAFYSREFIVDSLSYNWIKGVITHLSPDHIFVNELVTWQNPLNFINIIKELHIPYTVFIHDYFHICISWNLINKDGKFCNIPDDIEKCKECLSLNNIAPYISVYGNSNHDIISWRRVMQSFLQKACHIVCFSESSRNYLLKVYGDDLNTVVIEHAVPDIEAFIWKQRVFNTDKLLTIGIIGNLGLIKGEKILKSLVNHPEFIKLPVNLIVAGETSSFPKGDESDNEKLIVIGKYNREELPELLEKHNVSAVLTSSICPETFSFTTSEALLLGYPVICFDVGAPAERVKKYKSGIIVKDISAEELLNVFKEILDKPYLIKILSANTKKYVPPPPQEHLEKIFNVLEKV